LRAVALAALSLAGTSCFGIGVPRSAAARTVRRDTPRGCQVQRRAAEDANLLAFFTHELSEMPQRVTDLGPLGPLYFLGMAAVADSLTFPVTPVMVTAGYIFGLPLGTILMLISACCAASLHFLLARSMLQPQIEQLVAKNQQIKTINRAVKREGLKIMFLLRLEPLLPTSITNFAFGLSNASFVDFLLATICGYAPYTILTVSSATVLHDFFDGAEKPWYFYAVGFILYAGLLWLIADVAGKAIKEAIEEDESDMRGPDSEVVDSRYLME